MKIICFAGPNGSGKSTTINNFIQSNSLNNIPIINADVITKDLFSDIPDYNERNMAGAKYATALREKMIAENKDFMFETVMSTPRNLELLKFAKDKGYEITVVYVITNNKEINVQRVAKRVSEGGHDVPSDKIRERYDRCLTLLPDVLNIADTAVVYDNSLENNTHVVITKSKENILYTYYDENNFIEENIVIPFCTKYNITRIIGSQLPNNENSISKINFEDLSQ